MKKSLLTCFALCVFVFASVWPYEAHALEVEWESWSQHYFENKTPEKVEEFLEALNRSDILVEETNVQAPFAGFLSQIFTENKTEISEWLKDDYSDYLKMLIVGSLLLVNLEEYIPESYKVTSEYGPILETMKNHDGFQALDDFYAGYPSDLDKLWGAFFASGNDVFVHNVLYVLNPEYIPTGDRLNDIALRSSALWSIRSNMKNYDIVRKIVDEEVSQSGEKMKVLLDTLYIEDSGVAQTTYYDLVKQW